MSILAFPVHLAVRQIRKRDHNKGPYYGYEVMVPRAKAEKNIKNVIREETDA